MKYATQPFAFRNSRSLALHLGALVMLGFLPAFNCALAQTPARAQPPVPLAVSTTLPLTHAVVERVLRDTGEIVLDHEDLPNLGMPPMTMAFEVSSPDMLRTLKAGDRVKFQAEIIAGKPTVTRLERTTP
ncbi:copper-binding protein [Variovorax sp. RHLX14]|uniref:copper-binding protein n=1 Tax=Variovorax sp. RHLX14 TaxID=1259731 RepID=UPI003F454083